jgi:23S rRNA (cytosine1962-C5)-methyltransferase
LRFASEWKDFEVIATGGGEKLERWGDVFLLRPDPQAIWRASFDFSKFEKLNAKYTRSASGGGSWEILRKFKEEWTIGYKGLKFLISPTSFKHTGLFPEQAVNWDRVSGILKSGASVLNLFGYTGGATVACARAGATVTHVDASKGMVEVCKRNCKLNNLPDTSVRFIVDDCIKFVEREIRRGKKYDAIIMDPPSFGRGANGEVWKIEEHLDYLVGKCCELLSDKPLFFLINSYTTGLQPTVIKNVLELSLRGTKKSSVIEAYEIGLPTDEGIVLPAGASALATFGRGKE